MATIKSPNITVTKMASAGLNADADIGKAPSLQISGGENFATSKVGGQGKSLLAAKTVHRWAKRAESLVVCATKFGEHGRVDCGGFL